MQAVIGGPRRTRTAYICAHSSPGQSITPCCQRPPLLAEPVVVSRCTARLPHVVESLPFWRLAKKACCARSCMVSVGGDGVVCMGKAVDGVWLCRWKATGVSLLRKS